MHLLSFMQASLNMELYTNYSFKRCQVEQVSRKGVEQDNIGQQIDLEKIQKG